MKTEIRSYLLTGTFLRSVFLSASALTAVGLGAFSVTPAAAQDLTSGTLVGSVKGANGKPAAGATVTINGETSGYATSVRTDDQGNFRLSQIPLGRYKVEIVGADGSKSSDNVLVSLGAASSYDFMLGDSQTTEVVVVGRARRNLDFDKTTTGMVIDVQTLTDRVPLGRDLNALADIVPGISINDVFGSPSISGSSPAENIYYVNGMNVTNFRNFLGGTTIPFDFYNQVEAKTGGYSAEFGRSTGGAFITTTRSGSNQFKGGVSRYFVLPGLAESTKTVATDLNSGYDKYFTNRTKVDQSESNYWLSGPILKDHIYFFAFYNPRDFSTSSEITTADGEGNQYRTVVQKDPFYGGRLDFVLNPDHRLEYTYFSDDQTSYTHNVDIDGYDSPVLAQSGGLTRIVKYTGKFTDWFTLSAMYGRSSYNQTTSSPQDADPLVYDPTISTLYLSGNQNGLVEAGTDLRENYRLDADFYFNLKGRHHLKIGADQENLFAEANTFYSGHIYYRYYHNSASACRGNTDCVRVRVYESGGGFDIENKAWYIQDSWDVNDRLNLSLGIRNDAFTNKNAADEAFLDIKDQIAPRLGLSWDVYGDKSTRLTAFYGRYYLPIAGNTNIRMAGGETFNEKYYTYSAIDSNYVPTLGTYLGGTEFSNGEVPSADTLVSHNLDPQYQDEYLFGIERRLDNGIKVGVNLTYRKLSNVLEDSDIDYTNACAYLIEQGTVSTCGSFGSSGYVLINPGKDLVVTLGDSWGSATGETVTIPAAYLGLEEAKRSYQAVTFTVDRPWDGKWMMGGSLTLSRLAGNIEGGVKSDNGQDDTGLTQDFDEPGWVDGSYGLLPNHHGYSLKVYGSYAFTEKLQGGFNASILSPRKYGCIGYYPYDDGRASGGTATAWYCNGELTPRGESFSGDWINKLDINLSYTVPARFGSVKLTADVFNVFNAQGADQYYEQGEYTAAYESSEMYQKPSSYQTPRYVRLGMKYQF